QLRQSLMPFASGGVSIADVGRRLGAYMVDTMACGLAVGIGSAITTVVLTGVTTFGSVQMFGQNPTRDLLISFVAWSMQVGYFTVTEGIWGRAVGKWLFGLRVAGITGEPPGVRRMLLRALFIPGGLGLTCLITFLATQAQ